MCVQQVPLANGRVKGSEDEDPMQIPIITINVNHTCRAPKLYSASAQGSSADMPVFAGPAKNTRPERSCLSLGLR